MKFGGKWEEGDTLYIGRVGGIGEVLRKNYKLNKQKTKKYRNSLIKNEKRMLLKKVWKH